MVANENKYQQTGGEEWIRLGNAMRFSHWNLIVTQWFWESLLVVSVMLSVKWHVLTDEKVQMTQDDIRFTMPHEFYLCFCKNKQSKWLNEIHNEMFVPPWFCVFFGSSQNVQVFSAEYLLQSRASSNLRGRPVGHSHGRSQSSRDYEGVISCAFEGL